MTQVMKKYADVVRAYLDGADVQCRVMESTGAKWVDVLVPTWSYGYEYRIKPKEPQIVEKYIPVGCIVDKLGAFHHANSVYCSSIYKPIISGDNKYPVIANIKILCNEETGEVISVELVK